MSRVGKAPIQLPKGVSIDIAGSKVAVKGPKGELSRTLHPDMAINLENGVLSVSRPSDSRQHRSLHGLTRALLNNMVTGVSAGYSKILLIEGVGYRAEMDGKRLVLYVGYSHPVYFEPDNGISYTVEERGRKAVSYTHLDVYKRQSLGRWPANCATRVSGASCHWPRSRCSRD